jgi:hypothetical protein
MREQPFPPVWARVRRAVVLDVGLVPVSRIFLDQVLPSLGFSKPNCTQSGANVPPTDLQVGGMPPLRVAISVAPSLPPNAVTLNSLAWPAGGLTTQVLSEGWHCSVSVVEIEGVAGAVGSVYVMVALPGALSAAKPYVVGPTTRAGTDVVRTEAGVTSVAGGGAGVGSPPPPPPPVPGPSAMPPSPLR